MPRINLRRILAIGRAVKLRSFLLQICNYSSLVTASGFQPEDRRSIRRSCSKLSWLNVIVTFVLLWDVVILYAHTVCEYRHVSSEPGSDNARDSLTQQSTEAVCAG